jgi:hypothetical protein
MKAIVGRVILTLGVAMGVTLLAPRANAQCGYVESALAPAAFESQRSLGPGEPPSSGRGSSFLVSEREHAADGDPIVGFWRVTFRSQGNPGIPDGTVIDAGFSQWHSDGTEILNSSRPPATSNFCLGVWKRVEESSYKLNHFALSSDLNGNMIGPANIRETVRLSRDGNRYEGTFTIDQYDESGNLLAHITGQVSAKRITVDTPVGAVLSS